MPDPILISMATIPTRKAACAKAFTSLLRQKGAVATKILVHRKPVQVGRFRFRFDDARKFNIPEDYSGYVLTCDDDLIYSPEYVLRMIYGVEKYERKAVVSLHGGCVNPPIESYYRGGRDPKYSCLLDLDEDKRIHIPGTGVMAYHTDTIRFSPDDFPCENMADIQVGIKCADENVPVYCLAHKHGIVEHIETGPTIHSEYAEDDWEQTDLVNQGVWRGGF